VVQLHPGPPSFGGNVFRLIITIISLAFSIADASTVKTHNKPFVVQELSTPQTVDLDITFLDKDKKELNLESFEDNVILLNFWASWCSVCLKEVPELDSLQKEFRKTKLKILAVSEDFKGIDAVQEFYKLHSIKNLSIYVDDRNKLFNSFKVSVIPTSILLNKEGKEVARITGSAEWSDEELRELINKYL
jgi:thiol-disulfide isomerase/thioredoxin